MHIRHHNFSNLIWISLSIILVDSDENIELNHYMLWVRAKICKQADWEDDKLISLMKTYAVLYNSISMFPMKPFGVIFYVDSF